MTEDRWRQISSIYHAALERDVAERLTYVRAACAGDEELHIEVESLLAAARAPAILDHPAVDAAAQALAHTSGTTLIGMRLGEYQITGQLGVGGMGEVFRARDTTLGRDVALKVLPSLWWSDSERRARFDREARILASLNHPHIGGIYGVVEQGGTRALVLELIEGSTLAERLSRAGSGLPLHDAVTIAIQIAEALAATHRVGIVHRDLKPSNVMLTKAGVKLLDFGVAKTTSPSPLCPSLHAATSTPTLPTLTTEGTVLGTVGYMAPEQLDGREVGPSSDLFAFGAVLYEMVTGRVAFPGESQARVIAAILHSQPAVPSSVRRAVPAALDQIVMTCLAKDPDERWQSAADLARSLRWTEDGRMTVTSGAQQRRRRYIPWLVATVAIVTATLISIGVLRRSTSEAAVFRLDVATPPTTDPVSFALSPDGKQIVFVATGEKGSQLFLRSLDETIARPLAGTEDALSPFWAPDRSAIAFFAAGKLKRLDLDGGKTHVLANVGGSSGGSWNRTGTILFFGRDRGLMSVPATGGMPSPVKLEPRDPDRWELYPDFLPDGIHFLFWMYSTRPEAQGVYLGSLDGTAAERLLAADRAAVYASPGYLLFARQGALMAAPFDATRGKVTGNPVLVAPAVESPPNPPRGAFSVSSTGLLAYRTGTASMNQLVWVDRTGKLLDTLGSADGEQLFPELAPNGEYVSVQRERDVWLIDVKRGVPRRLTLGGINSPAVWSPDSERLFFAAVPSGPLFEKEANGTRDQQTVLASSNQRGLPNDWSRDGRTLLYQDSASGVRELWGLSLTGNRKPFPVVRTEFHTDEGQFSPDGRWIAYRSTESGRAEIYLQPFPGSGDKVRISAGGGNQPRWRGDGRELFYIGSDGRLMAVPITLPIGEGIPAVGAAVPLFATRLEGTQFPRHGYDVAADGQRFLMNVVAADASATPITLVVNWPVTLRK